MRTSIQWEICWVKFGLGWDLFLLPSFWFVRSTRIDWANRSQLESTTKSPVPAFNCTESEMSWVFPSIQSLTSSLFCVGTRRSKSVDSVSLKSPISDSRHDMAWPPALPHFSMTKGSGVIREASARALARVTKELERFKKLLRWQWMGLQPSFSNPGVARRLPSFGSLRILFAKVSRPQVLKLEGEACKHVSVGSTTYYGRGDCSTLKQGCLRLCFDNECQECQDFLVRRERQCGDVLRLRASNFLAQNQSGFKASWCPVFISLRYAATFYGVGTSVCITPRKSVSSTPVPGLVFIGSCSQ